MLLVKLYLWLTLIGAWTALASFFCHLCRIKRNFHKLNWPRVLKRQCHEVFDSRFFSSNNTPWAPDSRAKALLNSASNSTRYDRFSNAKIVLAVSMTTHAF
jgi:hypothetical protein